MTEQCMTVPLPPSANHLYPTVVRYKNGKPYSQRVTSTEAQRYKKTVKGIAAEVGIVAIEGNVTLTLDVYIGTRMRDLSNCIKVLEDALTGVAWGDDSQVDMIIATRYQEPDNPRVEVTIEASQCV